MKKRLSRQKPSKSKRLTVLAAALGFAFASSSLTAVCADDSDVLIADFNGSDYGAWRVEGEAFGTAPAPGTLPGQMDVSG
ncbi:MAG: hypothetical protein IIY07_06455, partial [Thermoguttaceae bacterium]|nr:hypothetical protein [Thermoguttaceae bacterium]